MDYVKCRGKCMANCSAIRCFEFRRKSRDYIIKEDLFLSGHRACQGCGAAIAIRQILKAAGRNCIVVQPTGCMEVVSTQYPETSWLVPYIHVAFENAAAVASGISRALKVKGIKAKPIVIAGDGGTVDIGLQSLSGMLERDENVLYICYDNEAYMNTGIQRSGATPLFASTTTTPAGKFSKGEDRPKKDIAKIAIAHNIKYVATASIAFPLDLMRKVEKALKINGATFIHILTPCPPGWRIPENKTIEVARLAVDTCMWILYEYENGEYKINYIPTVKKPVEEYLKIQGRFRHLTKEDIDIIQRMVDERYEEMLRISRLERRY